MSIEAWILLAALCSAIVFLFRAPARPQRPVHVPIRDGAHEDLRPRSPFAR